MARKQLVLATTKEGCIVPTSHKLNQDGYFRKTIDGRQIMYHRYVWIQSKGDIPEGYEIDHMCRNRACCNIEHLQCLEGTEHTIKTNIERSSRVPMMKAYWLETNCTGTFLGEKFGINFGTACKHIRKWKKELDDTIEITKGFH